MSAEKLCLKWDEFQQHVSESFGELREDFCDVTLASEDKKQIEVHKIILAASSPFFRQILKNNKHNHPLIYMRGFQYNDLLSIIDFMYYGETKVFQDRSS